MGETKLALLRMKEHLLSKGWCRHTFVDRSGRVCLMGAAYRGWYATTPQIFITDRSIEALKVVARYLGVADYNSLAEWNDHSERTFKQVIDAIDGALLLLDEQEGENDDRGGSGGPARDERTAFEGVGAGLLV